MTTTAVAAIAVAGMGRVAAQELPSGGSVTSGQATIGTPVGGNLTITQTSGTAIIGWQNFSIGQGNTVHFDNGSGATLNRVWGNVPSSLNGSLTATGSLYLVNPAGVTVGSNGLVATGGSFIASTHDVDDAAFQAQKAMTFAGSSDASVVNHGLIRSASGDVALIARRVENTGEIEAANGTAALAAGYEVLMRDTADADGKFVVKVGGADTQAKTSGAIRAAEVELRANGGNVYALAGNTSSVTRATGVQNRGGRIFLTAGQGGSVKVQQKIVARKTPTAANKAAGGEVRISGGTVTLGSTIDVSGDGAEGGLVIAAGRTIKVEPFASISASGTMGGTILIGGDYQGGKDAAKNYVAEQVETAETVTVEAGASLTADGREGVGGRIVVWSDDVTSFAGAISATGGGMGDGGDAEVSGKRLLSYIGSADLRALTGTFGTLLLDPYNITISAGANSNVSGFTPTGNDSVINVTTLQNALATANVVITTGGSGSAGAQAGDITVAAAVTWSSASSLTLDAYRHIAVNASISGGAGSKIFLRADNAGTGTGTVTFASSSVKATAAGGVSVYYNPTSYSSPTSFAANQGTSTTITGYMLVNTLANLQAVNTSLAGNYALGRDIDASATIGWNAGAGFNPVGTLATPFSGRFDGLGHTISNLTINRPTTDYVGLFGYTRNATLKNVDVVNANVVGRAYTGILSGLLFSYGSGAVTQLTNVATSGIVSGTSRVGGVIGWVQAGTNATSSLASALSIATVSGADQVGGAIGAAFSTIGTVTLSDIFATGAVSGTRDLGGLIGYTAADNGGLTLSNSYATGSVTGTSIYVGGLIGRSSAISGGISTLDQSYATGNVVAGGYTAGGLIGWLETTNSAQTISNSYATGTVTGPSKVGGLIGVVTISGATSTNNVLNSHSIGTVNATATGLTTTNVGAGGLMGRVETTGGGSTLIDGSYSSSAVTSQSGYAGGILGYSYLLSGFVDIRSSSSSGAIAGTTRLGGLAGAFDGNTSSATYNVTNSNSSSVVTGTGDYLGGLIGYISLLSAKATIANSHAVGSVSGVTSSRVGGLVGHAAVSLSNDANLVVTNASAIGSVSGNDYAGGLFGSYSVNSGAISLATVHASGAATGRDYVAGLVGYFSSGSASSLIAISDAYATGVISGRNNVGGFLGRSLISAGQSTIMRSYATGSVSGQDYVAGFVARNEASGGQSVIQLSYASGAISGLTNVGGFVGWNYASGSGSEARIDRSYATGTVNGITRVGGFAGYNNASTSGLANLNQSYATGRTIASGNYAGGFVGENVALSNSTATIAQSYALGPVSGASYVGGLIGHSRTFGASALVNVTQSYAIGLVNGTANVGGFIGYQLADAGSVADTSGSFWNASTAGVATAIGNLSNPAGVTSFQTSDVSGANYAFAASTYNAVGWDMSGTFGLVPGVSYAYHNWRFASGPSVVSGTVSGVSGGNAGLGVTAGVSGAILGSGFTGADGSYYIMGDPVSGAALAWLNGMVSSGATSAAEATSVARTRPMPGFTQGHATGLDLRSDWVWGYTSQTSYLSAVSMFGDARGGLTDPKIRYDANNPLVSNFGMHATGDLTVDTLLQAGNVKTRIEAGGVLSLASGMVLSSSASGDAFVLSGTSFVNQAGSNAFDLTGGGRWLVFANAPTVGNQFGGLDSANTAIWNMAYAPYATVAASGNRYVFANRPTATFVTHDRTKTYGDSLTLGAADVSVLGLNAGIAGIYLGDTLASISSGSAAVTSVGAPSQAALGRYLVEVSTGSLAATSGYAFAFSSMGHLNVVWAPKSTAVSAAQAHMEPVRSLARLDIPAMQDRGIELLTEAEPLVTVADRKADCSGSNARNCGWSPAMPVQ